MKKHTIASAVLIIYSALLIKVLVFKDIPVIRIGSMYFNFGGTQDGPPNLIPFTTISRYLFGQKILLIAVLNIFGNILLLVPVGFLAPLVYPKMRWKHSLALALASGSAIELMQVVLGVGIFDIDDIILNGTGVMVGYWAYLLFRAMMDSQTARKILLTAGLTLITAAAILGISFYREHGLPLGFESAEKFRMPDHLENRKTGASGNDDLCNGTGGTGQIISLNNNSMDIRRRDGSNQTIYLSEKTKVRTSEGPSTVSLLKTGDRVTIVTGSEDENQLTAMLVLVCKGPPGDRVK
jgi:glycopeptide antibiotics resistance protein